MLEKTHQGFYNKKIQKIMKKWKEESGATRVIQFKYRSGILTIYTSQPGWLIGKAGVLSDKYGKTRLENACQLALDHISQPGYKNIKMILQSNQDLKDKNDNVQSECDMHAFVRGKDYYGGRNNG